MKISINQINGTLREKVQAVIDRVGRENVIGLFSFTDNDFQYPWRSKGSYISVRIKTQDSYTSENIYYKKSTKTRKSR